MGGIARNFGDAGASYLGQGRDFVIEGDEYDSAFFDKTSKFLHYAPHVAVVNNVEFDHADISDDIDAVTLAFRRLVTLVPRGGLLLLGADSPIALGLKEKALSRVQTFRTSDQLELDWQAHNIEPAGERTRFRVRRDGMPFGDFEVPLLGQHNIRNALAAIAVATDVGISVERVAEGLSAFAGVKRRLEVVGVAGGVTVYDDFAHHPTAVAETLAGLRASHPDARIWAVSNRAPPRPAGACSRMISRRRSAPPTKCSSRPCTGRAFRKPSAFPFQSSCGRSTKGRHARRAESIDDIVNGIARERRSGDLVVLMSNGGFGGIHKKLVQALA